MERDWDKVRAGGRCKTFQAAVCCVNAITNVIIEQVSDETPIRITIDYDPVGEKAFTVSVDELPRRNTQEESDTRGCHRDPRSE